MEAPFPQIRIFAVDFLKIGKTVQADKQKAINLRRRNEAYKKQVELSYFLVLSLAC
jgi:hypothetical protein